MNPMTDTEVAEFRENVMTDGPYGGLKIRGIPLTYLHSLVVIKHPGAWTDAERYLLNPGVAAELAKAETLPEIPA